jgi:uncharacterized protein YggT (Ycf19 family)
MLLPLTLVAAMLLPLTLVVAMLLPLMVLADTWDQNDRSSLGQLFMQTCKRYLKKHTSIQN